MSWSKTKLDGIKASVPYALVGGPFGSNLTTADYVSEGVPVIRGNNLPPDRRFLDDDFAFVTETKADSLRPNTAYPGDVIFTQRGTLGQVGDVPLDAKFPRYVISQSQMKLTVDPETANGEFVYYFFRTPGTVRMVTNRALSSGVPHINLGILKDLEIPLPPLPVQRRIAEILTAYDDLIANSCRRMELLEAAARQLYREWFVRLRFPGRGHAGVRDGVPEGWDVKRLAAIAEVNRECLGNGFDGSIEYIDISSVTPGQVTETETYDFQEAPSRARRVVRHGDVIWSCVRPNRRSHTVIWKPAPNLIVSTGFAVLTPTSVPTSFLYQATATDAFVSYLENHARGVAYPAVVAGDFERAELLVPPGVLLEAFDTVAEPLLGQLSNLRLQNQRLRAARDLLLPRLMSGEIAV